MLLGGYTEEKVCLSVCDVAAELQLTVRYSEEKREREREEKVRKKNLAY